MKVLCILLCVVFTSGFYTDNNETHEEKIVGGDYVRIEEVPYHASLLSLRLNIICGAAIIHEYWVITASHCVKNRNRMDTSVQTGNGFRRTTGTVHSIERIIMHDHFETHSKDNDIALIKLAGSIQFNGVQQRIELAKRHDIPREGELMRISGFGKIGEHLHFSYALKAAYVPVINQENCERAYSSNPITNNMFCAGNGDADACYGDSGGPGVIHGKLHGIISTGTNCASRKFPGVYTRMYKYYNWIEEKTGIRF